MKVLDNNINALFGEIGLNESERAVYFAGSKTGNTSAELLKRTKIPRPTLMAALKSLKEYGLCETHRRDGRSLFYVMQPAANLKQFLGQKSREIDSLAERLDTVSVESAELMIIEKTGQEGLKDLLELALRCKSRQWQIIAPYDNALRFMPHDYTKYFKRIRSQRQIVSQTLWADDSKKQQVTLKDILMRKPRYVPTDIATDIPTLLLAFDDSLLVIEGKNNPKSAVIHGRAAVRTFQLVFEMAWRSAKS